MSLERTAMDQKDFETFFEESGRGSHHKAPSVASVSSDDSGEPETGDATTGPAVNEVEQPAISGASVTSTSNSDKDVVMDNTTYTAFGPKGLVPISESTAISMNNKDSRYFGQTSLVKKLYGTLLMDLHPEADQEGESELVTRWSEYADAREEEQALNKKASDFAIIHRLETYGSGRAWRSSSIEVQSPRLLELLRRVLPRQPDVLPNAKTLQFKPPYDILLHRWTEVEHETSYFSRSSVIQEVALLREAMGADFAAGLEKKRAIDNSQSAQWQDLNYVFSAGDLVLSSLEPLTMHRLNTLYRVNCSDRPSFWAFLIEQVDWNGRRFGRYVACQHIEQYDGRRAINTLPFMPVRFREDQNVLQEMALRRGKRFQQLLSFHCKEYSGKKYCQVEQFGGMREVSKTVHGRVLVDALAYHRFAHDGGVRKDLSILHEGDKVRHDDDDNKALHSERPEAPEALNDEQLMIVVPRVKGFDLKENDWCEFDLDGITDPEYRVESFNRLRINQADKDLMKVFIENSGSQALHNSDLIANKGSGIIILLYGPPGVGKTLTAESAAEYSQKALYSLSPSHMRSASAESKLNEALECCQMWSAVLLIDEADVFLQSRSAANLEQNQLVSVFLRQLEYYQGLVFLTTNRYACIDEAFKSRADLVLTFTNLDVATRKAVWNNFIHDIPTEICGITKSDIETLATRPVNGREIRNVLKMAQLVARYRKQKLRLRHVEYFLDKRETLSAREASESTIEPAGQ